MTGFFTIHPNFDWDAVTGGVFQWSTSWSVAPVTAETNGGELIELPDDEITPDEAEPLDEEPVKTDPVPEDPE